MTGFFLSVFVGVKDDPDGYREYQRLWRINNRSCNIGLGLFKSDVAILQKAINYLEISR